VGFRLETHEVCRDAAAAAGNPEAVTLIRVNPAPEEAVFDHDVAAELDSLGSGGGGDYTTYPCGIAAENCNDSSVSERTPCPTKKSKEFRFVGVCDGAKAALIRLAADRY
jgi:hypothetical protein